MEFTLATIKAFLGPFFDAYELDINNVFSVTFEPGGVEIVQYKLNKDGQKIIMPGINPDSCVMESEFYPYLG